jgi:hypothetical protein
VSEPIEPPQVAVALIGLFESTPSRHVTEAQLERALDDLVRSGGELAQSLLGARRG